MAEGGAQGGSAALRHSSAPSVVPTGVAFIREMGGELGEIAEFFP